MSRLRNWLLTLSIPIQKLMQKLHVPDPLTTFLDAEEVLSKMKPGDILLSREEYHFTNLFIPGFWSHAAIFGGENEVVEAVGTGVRSCHFYDWVLRKHNWCVLRPGDKEVGQEAFKYAWNALQAKYDYLFFADNKAFYCSELVYDCYRETTGPFMKGWGDNGAIIPDDFYRYGFRIIFEHRHKPARGGE